MSAPDGPAAPAASTNLDSLTGRFVGSLLLLGGVVLLAIAAAIRQLPTAAHDGGVIYILPGGEGRHGLEPLGTLVLAASGTLLALLGVLGLAFGRLSARRPPSQAPVVPAKRRKPERATRPLRTLAIGAAALAAVLVFRWLSSHP